MMVKRFSEEYMTFLMLGYTVKLFLKMIELLWYMSVFLGSTLGVKGAILSKKWNNVLETRPILSLASSRTKAVSLWVTP